MLLKYLLNKRSWWLALIVLTSACPVFGAASVSATDKPAATAAGGSSKKQPGAISPNAAVQETVSDIMLRARLVDQASTSPRHFINRRRPANGIGGTVEFPVFVSTNSAGGIQTGSTYVSQPGPFSTNGTPLAFTGATLGDTGSYPPDTMGAVGPTQFIVAVNGRLRSFDKTTGLPDNVLNASMDSFFNSVMTPPANNNFTSDPRIRYDRLSGRWFVIIIDVPGQTGTLPNRVLIAVSDGGVITAGTVWSFYQFQHDLVSPAGDTGEFADYPTLGIDANALYIGVNVFASNGNFDNTSAFVVRKSSLLSGGPIAVTAFRKLITFRGFNGTGPYTPQGVDNFDPNATNGYFVGIDYSSTSRLQLRRVSNPAGTPTLSGNVGITVATFAPPLVVPSLGATGTLDGLDERLLAAHYRNGSLWTSHNVGVNNAGGTTATTRNGVRWYQITGIPTGQTPTVQQSGTIYDASSTNLFYWMGTIMVSGQGHAVAGFSSAAASQYVNASVAGRLATAPAGTFGSPLNYTVSSSDYNPPYDRWGDYSYTSLDPIDDMTMWTIQEYVNGVNSYAVQIGKIAAPPPAFPASASPSSLTQGVAGITVTVQGITTNGSGFFDPGLGFSNRLTTAVSGGGITINSVLYNNPTNISLNLTIASNAVLGARILTVTNPDGQISASSSGLLTVVPPGQPPSITAPLASQTIQCGSNVSFTVTANGTLPLKYQWSFDGVAITAATNTSLTLTNVHLPSHTVAVVVTNLFGSATSSVPLTVQDTLAPLITLNGANPFYVELGSAYADPGASASDLCAGSVIASVIGAVNTAAVGANILTYFAADGNGNTNTATRTVIVRDTTPPVISWSFTNLVLAANSNCVALMPDVTGTNGLLASDLSGAVTATQNPTNNTELSLGTNVVVLTVMDASGNAAFSTNTVIVQDQTPPLIFAPPQSQTNLFGAAADFSVAASACTPLAWQWFFNTAPLDGQTNSALTINAITTTNSGNYFVVATAAGGSSTSAVATLTVDLIPPAINGGAFNSNDGFTLNLAGTPGYLYVLEATTNLGLSGNWLPLATNVLGTNGLWQFDDASATNLSLQFYRLRLAQ